jgi:hypothetical protein
MSETGGRGSKRNPRSASDEGQELKLTDLRQTAIVSL